MPVCIINSERLDLALKRANKLKDGERIFLQSFDDRNEANRQQIVYAGVIVSWNQGKKLSIAVHRIPRTGAWGLYLEPRNG